MRDAIGHTFLYNVVITLVFVIGFVLIASLSYSKGFKAKNKIISIIEDNRIYHNDEADSVMEQIDLALRDNGYRPKSVFRHKKCPTPSDSSKELLEESPNFPYCVYRTETPKGIYYSVTIYTRFEIPLLSGFLEFPISGDTRTIYDLGA